MTHFIHTADWQLGMTRHYLGEDAQARFTQDRFDAITRIGEVAREKSAAFVIVAGDVFEHNRLDRKTVVRALDAMQSIPVPVYLLPGNHDPLDMASIYDSPTFKERCPDHVHVIRDTEPLQVTDGVELIGAPWHSKRPLSDLVVEALADVEPNGNVRIVLAHGAADILSPNQDDPALINMQDLEDLVESGKVHYVGLGDRHSVTELRPRVWYSGAHVATDHRDFQQTEPNHILLVDVDAKECHVESVKVGTWSFRRKEWTLTSKEDVDIFEQELEAVPDKQRTILKAGFHGNLDIEQKGRLEALMEHAQDLLASFELWDRKTDLVVTPSDADFERMELKGFARSAFQRIMETASQENPDQQAAQDGLSLIYRLAKGGRR